jgi:hypothetical protein
LFASLLSFKSFEFDKEPALWYAEEEEEEEDMPDFWAPADKLFWCQLLLLLLILLLKSSLLSSFNFDEFCTWEDMMEFADGCTTLSLSAEPLLLLLLPSCLWIIVEMGDVGVALEVVIRIVVVDDENCDEPFELWPSGMKNSFVWSRMERVQRGDFGYLLLLDIPSSLLLAFWWLLLFDDDDDDEDDLFLSRDELVEYDEYEEDGSLSCLFVLDEILFTFLLLLLLLLELCLLPPPPPSFSLSFSLSFDDDDEDVRDEEEVLLLDGATRLDCAFELLE